ncbi:hypothetical protein ACFSC3_02325 [Sphingomonas floccifaciens]|uniref:Uncharacterized protein n=1 Tax=Sphingomonas floccifaciens TaxID=1844115 RepID=A0ABW4NAS9_9SPHN
MAHPPSPARPTLRRSPALMLRDWSRRAANDNVPFGWSGWQTITPEGAARYYAAVARAELD